tara:strand:- start:181 stop:396 length:216 start_codon:yes stop_codon:yes gene_type:complete
MEHSALTTILPPFTGPFRRGGLPDEFAVDAKDIRTRVDQNGLNKCGGRLSPCQSPHKPRGAVAPASFSDVV